MTKPVTIPNTFATATTAIPLSNLDADFSTVATALNDANTYSNYAPDTGSANAYVVTLSGVSTTYSAGLRIQFKAGNANTTASTLNVNGGGAKNITYQDATAIASGTIAANSIVDVMYDGTQFLLMNDPAGATGGDVVGPSSATDNAIVRFDGTTGKLVQNSVVTIADSTGDVSGVGQLNATTVDATNIEVTNIKAKDGTAAASIADSTGVISITSNPVLSGGTANGVLYLNGSKVATSGSALVFDGTNFATTGTATATKLIPTGNVLTGNGLHLPAANSVAITTNGANAIYIDSSQNVGIGTSSPGAKLEVSGGDSLLRGGKFIIGPTAGGNGAGAIRGTLNGVLGSLIFQTENSSAVLTDVMTLDSSGNLGIGTSSPAMKLDVRVANSASLQGALNLSNSVNSDFSIQLSSSVAQIGTGTSTPIVFATGNAERMRLTSGGNFKIGGTADRGTTEGDKQLVLFNGTAPVGTLTNGISLYSSSGEAYVMDAAGNATLFSPHDRDTNEWIFRSKHTPSGKVLKIDVERLLRFVNDHFGLDAVQEFIEP